MKEVSIIGHLREALEMFLGEPTIPADKNLRTFYSQRRYLGSRDRREISRDYYLAIRYYRTYLPSLYPDLPETAVPPPETVAQTLARLLLARTDYLVDDVHTACGIEQPITPIFSSLSAKDSEETVRIAREHGFPHWLTELIAETYSYRTASLLDALNEEAEPELRLRPGAGEVEEVVEELLEAGARNVRVSELVPEGLALESRVNLPAISAIRSGRAIVQSLGSQLIGLLLGALPGEAIFDGCAGAGGKTIQIADMLKGSGRVVAHDISQERLGRLEHRVRQLGVKGISMISPAEFKIERTRMAGTFDALLIDAPCSGSGTIRRNPGLKLTLVPEAIDEVVKLQGEILRDHATLVRPGGRLVYATCSLLKRENQNVVEKFLAEESRWSVESADSISSIDKRFVTEEGYLVTDPDLDGLDGFFAVRLRRGE